MIETLFRFEDKTYSTVSIDPGGGETYGVTPVKLELYSFKVISETACGFWISYAFSKKWVGKTSKRRFAHATQDEARAAFIKRKEFQARVAQAKITRANTAIELAKNKKETNV